MHELGPTFNRGIQYGVEPLPHLSSSPPPKKRRESGPKIHNEGV